jgi:hypothetical protein
MGDGRNQDSTRHTPEPWRVSNYRPQRVIARDPAEGTYEHGDDKFPTLAHFESVEDGKRAVACVNACAGIPTELLELMGVGGIQKASGAAMKEARTQHAEAQKLGDVLVDARRALFCEASGLRIDDEPGCGSCDPCQLHAGIVDVLPVTDNPGARSHV